MGEDKEAEAGSDRSKPERCVSKDRDWKLAGNESSKNGSGDESNAVTNAPNKTGGKWTHAPR